jgi:hypothetical protein
LFLLVTIKPKTLPDKKYSLGDKPDAIHIGINNLVIENFMMTSVFVLILWFLVLMTYILLNNFISAKPNEETFWHYQGIKAKIFIPSMFKFLPTVSSVQSILINNSVDLGGAPIVFQGSSCPIIKHKQIIIRCLLSNEIIQVLIQQFVTSMCTKLTFGRQFKIINNRFNPESQITLAIMSFILQNKY